jgi:hypothetical protein
MIPKPTTHSQAVQNALQAAESAHVNMQIDPTTPASLSAVRRAEGWAHVAQAWASIAEQLPIEESVVGPDHPFHCTDQPCTFSSATGYEMANHHQAHQMQMRIQAGDVVVLTRETYNVMKAFMLAGNLRTMDDESVNTRVDVPLNLTHDRGIWTMNRR